MAITLGLAGDAMLGRSVAERLHADPSHRLFAEEVVDACRAADLFLLNLECCISGRGVRWPDPRKPFFFRAPPVAADRLGDLGVDAVTLANNHALDYGQQALLDTFVHLERARIRWVGAGPELGAARRPLLLDAGGMRLAVIGFSDHPPGFAATTRRPGISYADLWRPVPDWLLSTVSKVKADLVLVTPHWGPNMAAEPHPYVRDAAHQLREAGADLIAGHSAHVFHGVAAGTQGWILYDLGDFIDDYAVDRELRNDLGLLWLVEIGNAGPQRVEAVPLALDYCHTRLASDAEAAWIQDRLTQACAPFGTSVHRRDGRMVIEPACAPRRHKG